MLTGVDDPLAMAILAVMGTGGFGIMVWGWHLIRKQIAHKVDAQAKRYTDHPPHYNETAEEQRDRIARERMSRYNGA